MSKADEIEEAIKYFRKRIDICLENAEICDENNFDEEATCLRKEQILIEIILNYIENSIPKQLVEEKLKEIELPNVIVGGRRNSKTLEYGKKLGKIEILKELLEGK